jgi:hypothetical protein
MQGISDDWRNVVVLNIAVVSDSGAVSVLFG